MATSKCWAGGVESADNLLQLLAAVLTLAAGILTCNQAWRTRRQRHQGRHRHARGGIRGEHGVSTDAQVSMPGAKSRKAQHTGNQVQRLEAYGCERIYCDDGHSGKLVSRPEWDTCITVLREGDTLVITKLDRIGRSLMNLVDVVNLLGERGVQIKCLDQGEVDTTTPNGKVIFHIMSALAAWEAAMTRERTLDGLAAARERHGGSASSRTEHHGRPGGDRRTVGTHHGHVGAADRRGGRCQPCDALPARRYPKEPSMGVRIELEGSESLTVGDWEAFLRHARRAGAAASTGVREVMAEGTDVLVGWQVSLEGTDDPAPETVALPVWLVHDLLSVVREVAQSDGDVRGLESAQAALQNAYDHMLEPVLGENLCSKRGEPAQDATS
jgi:hypothetical protein